MQFQNECNLESNPKPRQPIGLTSTLENADCKRKKISSGIEPATMLFSNLFDRGGSSNYRQHPYEYPVSTSDMEDKFTKKREGRIINLLFAVAAN